MKKLKQRLFLLTLLLCTKTSYSQYNLLDNTTASNIEDSVDDILDTTNSVGLAVGVIFNNQIVYLKGFGDANQSIFGNTPVDECTLFRWASVSKVLTAIRAMQQVESGDLDTTATVSSYVPEYPRTGVRVSHAMFHQTGMINYGASYDQSIRDDYINKYPTFNAIKSIDCFKDEPLNFTTGTLTMYSTFNYNLLGAVIERASTGGFERQIRLNIAEPAGMHTLQPEYDWRTIPNLSDAYDEDGNLYYSNPRSQDGDDITWKLPGGGYVGSITDLALFARSIMDGTLVTPATLTDMSTLTSRPFAGLDNSGNPTYSSFGRGFFLNGGGVISHSGSQGGASSMLLLDPANGNGVVVLINTKDQPAGSLAWDILNSLGSATASPGTFPGTPSSNTSRTISGLSSLGISKYEYDNITAQGYVVRAGSDVRLIAGKKIVLKTGFKATSNSAKFLAHIEVTNDNCRNLSSKLGDSEEEFLVDEQSNIIIYPNPTNGTLYLSESCVWSVFGVTGGPTLLSGEGMMIDIGEFPSGVYLVSINGEYQRVVKQ